MNDYDKKRQEQREKTSIKILDASVRCFGKNGYANTAIKDIAEMAEVAPSLICKYFDSKENLLAEAYRYSTIQSYPIPDGEPDLRQRVEILINQTLEIMKTKPDYFEFFMKLIYTADLPEIFLNTRRELFNTAPIYSAFENWLEIRHITEGAPYDYFILFLRTEYTIIDFYRQVSHIKGDERLNAGVILSYIAGIIEEGLKKS